MQLLLLLRARSKLTMLLSQSRMLLSKLLTELLLNSRLFSTIPKLLKSRKLLLKLKSRLRMLLLLLLKRRSPQLKGTLHYRKRRLLLLKLTRQMQLTRLLQLLLQRFLRFSFLTILLRRVTTLKQTSLLTRTL